MHARFQYFLEGLEELLDSIYPRACLLCGRAAADPLACLEHRLPEGPAGVRCERCARALAPNIADGNLCPECREQRPRYGRLSALGDWRQSPALREWVLAFKHGGRRDLAEPLAAAVVRQLERAPLASAVRPLDMVVPVPLHATRHLERGYDQARLLAQATAERLDLEMLSILARVRATGVQGAPHSPGRRRNVEGAFEVEPGWSRRLAAGTVWLVDDVCTSGATLEACARALRRAGARRFVALVLARAG